MATVIDSLVVTLGLDTSKFTEQQKKSVDSLRQFQEAANKHTKPVQKGMDDLVGTFKEFQGRLLAIGAIIATGLGFNRLVQDITKLNTELGFTSKTLGISAQQLSEWEQIGRTVGATSGDISQNLKSLFFFFNDTAATETSKLGAFMGQVGIKPLQPNDTPDAVAKRLSEWYQGQPNKAYASHLLQSRGGLSQGMINLLSLGPEEIQRRLDQAKRFAPTDAEIAKFTKLTEAFGELLNVIDRLTTKALVPFLNVLTKILKMLTDWLGKWAENNQTPAEAAGEGFARLGLPELKQDPAKPSLIQRGWNWLRGNPSPTSPQSAAPPANDNAAATPNQRPGTPQQRSDGSSSSAPEPASTVGPGGTSLGSNDVNEAIERASKAYGLNPTMMKGVASIESAMNPSSNMNRATQYKGLFQIGREEWRQHGQGGNIYNAEDNAFGAARLMRHNMNQFKARFGRDPTPTEVYLIHQQGLGFYTRGTMTNIGGNPYPGMRGPQTPATFEAGWGRALNRHMNRFGGDTESANSSSPPGGTPTPTANIPRLNLPGTGAGGGAQGSFDNWRSLGLGARGHTMEGPKSSISNSQSSETHVGNMNITTPPGASPSEYAAGIAKNLGTAGAIRYRRSPSIVRRGKANADGHRQSGSHARPGRQQVHRATEKGCRFASSIPGRREQKHEARPEGNG